MPAVSDADGAGLAEGGLAWVLLAERAAGLRAAGLAAVARGASTVTAGSDVWAFAFDGRRDSALPSTKRLALPKAR
jgi:hypothetical protein